jgi:hypothetical protein
VRYLSSEPITFRIILESMAFASKRWHAPKTVGALIPWLRPLVLVSSLLLGSACGQGSRARSNEPLQPTMEPGESSMLDAPGNGAQPMMPLGPRASDDPSLSEAARMEALFLENCAGSCHLASCRSPYACEGFHFVGDMLMQGLVAEGKIVPCDWGESIAGTYHSSGGSVPPMSAADQARLESFVNGMCSNLTDGGPSDVERIASETLLRQSCGECHGAESADAGLPAGGVGNIDDIASLIERELITPCGSAPIAYRGVSVSRIVNVMRDGSMPPPGSDAPRPSSEDIESLAAFIDRPCAR